MPTMKADRDYRVSDEFDAGDDGISHVHVRVTKQSAPVEVHVEAVNPETEEYERVRGVLLGGPGGEDHLEHDLVLHESLKGIKVFPYSVARLRSDGPVTEAEWYTEDDL